MDRKYNYYCTLVGILDWSIKNYTKYNGYLICAHPSPDIGRSPVRPNSQGYYKKLSQIKVYPEMVDLYYSMHTQCCHVQEPKPIWWILKKIDQEINKEIDKHV